MAQSKKSDTPDFETALNELHQLIEQMEQGQLSLESSLQQFERGVTLIRHCQETLQKAEQKVQLLSEKNTLTAYNPDSE